MKATDKAGELVSKFLWPQRVFDYAKKSVAKECALIAVSEIILSNPHSNPLNTTVVSTMDYWNEVKSEIEKL